MKRKLLILFLTCVVGWLSPLNAQETTFSYDFNSDMSGWYTQKGGNAVAQYSDTYSKWTLTPNVYFGKANYQGNGSTNAIVSYSYDIEGYYYQPDNYIITMSKYVITASSKLSWYAKAPGSSSGEYYEVVISTDNGSTFNTVFSETLTNVSSMTLKEVSLSSYNGSSVQIGFRHCQTEYGTFHTNGSHIVIDDVVLSADAAGSTGLTVTATASDTEVYTGETVTLTASAEGGSGNYTSYVWDCTSHTLQGTEFWGSGNEYTFMPTSTGTYTFTCTVTDSESNTATSDPVTVSVTEESESAIDLNKQYRIKVNSSPSNYDYDYNGWYLHVKNHDEPNNNPNVGIVNSQQESDDQIFTIEENGSGQYYLKTADGFYIKCATGNQYWCVYAYSTTEKTPLVLEYLSNGVEFYIKDYDKMMGNGGSDAGLTTNNYFKVENSSIYCDASSGKDDNGGYVCTWVLEEYVAPPLEITSAAASASEVYTGTEVTLTASATGGSGNYTYNWTCTQGNPAATDFYNTTQAVATFKPTSAGTYKFTCTITDNNDGTSVTSEEITVTVNIKEPLSFPYTVEIGEGATTGGWLPLNSGYGYNISQQLYLSNEINGQEDMSGTYVKSIAFNVTELYSASRHIQVYLKSTNNTTLSAMEVMSSENKCFDGEVEFVEGWSAIEFTSPFLYQGGNLIVCVNDLTLSYIDNKYQMESKDDLALGATGSATSYDPTKTNSITATNTYSFRNNIQFTFTDDPSTPLTLQVIADNAATCDNSDIQLTATATGGTENYNYNWTSETEGALEMLSATNIANPVFTPSSIDAVSSTVTYTCTVNDGVTEVFKTISLTVYKKPVFELPASVVVNYGETATIEVVYDPSYVDIILPNIDGYNSEQKDANTIVFSYVPTEDADLVFEAYNTGSYSYTTYEYLCKETKTVEVRVINENKEVEIGENESLWSRYYLPVKAENYYSLTQQIYTAAELGIKEASEITSISFKAISVYPSRNIEIYLANTELNTFPNGNPNGEQYASALSDDFVNMEGEPNFTGTVSFTDDWTEIILDTPFEYEVGKNIILTVNDISANNGGAAEFAHYSTGTDIRSIVMYNNSAAYDAKAVKIDDKSFTFIGNLFMNNNIKLAYKAIAQAELVAEINVDDEEICDGENSNRFEMYATKVENATYNWYLVVDEVDNLLEENVREYTYSNPNPGTYKIKLVVTQNGLSKEVTKELTINPMPNAAVVMGTNGYGFVDEEIGFATTEDHITGTTYAIDLNVDDTHSNYYNVELDTHEFNVDGTFYYTVEASIGECETTLTKGVTIYPAASFTAGEDFYACKDQEVVFTNTTKTPNSGGAWNFDEGKGEGFVWNFGDGKTEASNGETVTHKYTATGTYNVTLTVTKSGISNVYEHQVIVSELPVADFTYEGDEYALTDITFTATNAGDGATYAWDFGDDTEGSTGLSCKHQYAKPSESGGYTVTLTVHKNGCSSTKEKTITIEEKVSGAAIEPAFVELGDRPNNGWMRPYTINITPDGNTSLTISTLTVEDNYSDEDPLIVLNHAELPVTLDPGEMFPVEVSTKIIGEGIGDGSYDFDILVNGSDPTNKTDEHIGAVNIYTAYTTDIVEVALEIDASAEETYTPLDEAGDLYPNYLLPGVDTENEYYDAVFKFTFEEATQLTATVNGTDSVAYVYPENFGDEPGPGLTNYVGYVNPDAPVQLEFVGFEFDFTYDYIDYGGYSGYVQETELWTSGPKDGEENAWFITGNDAINGGEDNMYVTSCLRTEDNYFITKDKYYISETARFSMNVWANRDYEMSYYVFVSEDGTNFTPVYNATVSEIDKANSIDFSLSEYAGKEYYIGVVHVGVETLPSSTSRIRLDNIKLYEPETRALRANAEPTLNIMLEAGTYYLVAAAANNDFTVTIGSETLSLPGQATDPRPKDYSNVAAELEQLTWTFGNFTEEYQVLFGTTNPPTEVLVDWNNNIENASCALSTTLMTNTVYYWQVNAKNILGTTEGAVWRFATPFDAPQNLALNPLEIEENETSVFTWNAIDNASLTGYNIYIDNVKNNTELVTSATYTISGLSYKVDPYIVQVEAVYNVDGFEIKSKSYKIELKVNAEASVKGFVYDATTGEPIVGATVTYATTELTTDANGYTGKVPAGNYRAVARMAGYNKSEVNVELVPSEETYTYDFTLEPTMTLATGVIATERDDKAAVDVEWQFNLEGGPMFEDFENGFTYEWTTSADYPWEVVANGYEEGSVGYELYGGYCVKSTNSDYDYDQENNGYKEDGDTPFELTTSYLELTTFIPFDGKISFYYRIDSDPWGDYGKFYIDDVQQGYNLMGENSQWLTDSKLEFDVTAGTHTFKWEYSKDEGWYYGTDAFYVDNITFYENTNLYNVYRQDILTPTAEPVLLEDDLTVKELADTEWANEDFADGIYQWGVSVKYNEPAGDLLNEDFEGVEEPETFLTGWTKYTEEVSYEILNQWHVNETGEYGISAYGGTGYSAFVSPLPGESVFYFVTPMVNASRQATLEFDYIIPCYREEDFPNDFSKFKVAYSTSSTGPWTDLTSFNKTSVEDWTHATVELPLEKELYIAFIDQNVENWGKGIGLDNVRIHRVAVQGESEIAWSNLIAKGNELVTEGNWNVKENWSRTHVPTAEEVAVIKAAGTVNEAGAVANAVLVDNGTLTIGENGVLIASTVIDSVAADITINAGGQLVHSNEGVMATFVKGIQAYTDANNNDGWYTISSPLAADINASDVDYLLDGEFDLYRYDEPTHYWENYEDAEDAEGPNNTDWDNNSAVIEKGRGYLYANKADKQLSFAGELNVADVTTTLSAQASSLKGFNLLGNPFAHNIYKGVAFNGSIADAHYTLNYHGEWQVVTSDNPIKSGAGFLVQATEGANLTISKTNAQTRAAANSMLAVTVVNNVFEDVAYVSFNDGIGLEKIGHMNEYAPMVYIPGDFNNYAYATVEEDVTEVPVNFEAMTMGEYTIAVKAKNCEYETMILVDNLTGKETNLLKDSYTFMATTTDDPDRFVIKLAKDAEVEDSFIYINNGELIFDNLSNDAIINVFDVLGRNVATFNNCGDTTFRVSTDLFADGVYMVRVIEGNNVKVQKMVIE